MAPAKASAEHAKCAGGPPPKRPRADDKAAAPLATSQENTALAASQGNTADPPQHPDMFKVDGSSPAARVMTQLMPWVARALKKYMGTEGFKQFLAGKELHTYPPLDIGRG